MKFIIKTQMLLLTFVAVCFSACHNGDKPVSDQEKKLDHLIFEEICYDGTYHESLNQPYKFDNYIKITNPTDQSFYLDGMGLAISALQASSVVTLGEGTDVTKTHFTASTLMRFPGNSGEKNHELKPGHSVYIASIAHDHTKNPMADNEESDYFWYNPASYDLSKIDYQWMTESEVKYQDDFEYNKSVPSLIRVYPDGDRQIPYTMASDGYAIALINFPAGLTDEQINAQTDDNPYRWVTSWSQFNTGSHGHGGKNLVYLKFPNEIVMDAVQICSQESYKWSIIPGVDTGYTSTYDMDLDKNYLRALYRKYDGLKFVDTNNSTEDFEVRPASMWLKNHKVSTVANN